MYKELSTKRIAPPEDMDSDLELPLDAHGVCIFHSAEVAWKRENKFKQRFMDLLNILEVRGGENGQQYDFQDFVFVGDPERVSEISGRPELKLENRSFGGRAEFGGARFIDSVQLHGLKFEDHASFKRAQFCESVHVIDTCFSGVDFDSCVFEARSSFKKIDFCKSYVLFTGSTFKSFSRFTDSTCEGIADFSGATFGGQEADVDVRFENLILKGFVDFSKSKFDVGVQFHGVKFLATVDFVDTEFNIIESTLKYLTAPASFSDIELGESAALNLVSTDAQNKMFKHEASFNFKEEKIKGVIKFQNVNFMNILPKSRERLLRLCRAGKVEIGSGCIKYRFQTEVKSIALDGSNQNLLLEIAQTFARYFSVKNGYNLGVEIVEKRPDRIRLFYFTDENISEEEFLSRLEDAERGMWKLLTVQFDSRYLITEGETNDALLKQSEDTIINTVDGVSALLGTFFRVGIRIAFGRWAQKDTAALLNVVKFSEGQINAAGLHQAIEGRYTGSSLLRINAKQNQKLVLAEAGGLERLEEISPGSVDSEEGRRQDLRRKLKILFLAANPRAASRLAVDEEVAKIKASLKSSRERDRLLLEQEAAVTIDSCMQAILDESPNIVHFSGHGSRKGIAFQDESGRPRVVSADALSSLFQLFKETVQCVLLNSCYSEFQAKAIKQHIPHVIGISSVISDSASVLFSTGFYKAIGAGKDIPFAFGLGIVAIKMAGVGGENAPVLL